MSDWKHYIFWSAGPKRYLVYKWAIRIIRFIEDL